MRDAIAVFAAAAAMLLLSGSAQSQETTEPVAAPVPAVQSAA